MSCIIIICLSLLAGLVFYRKTIARSIAVSSELSKITKFPIPCYPLVGHAISLASFDSFFKQFVSLFHELAASKAKLGILYMTGQKSWVWALHPDTAGVLLKSTKNLSKATSYRFLLPLAKEGLVTSTGKKWHTRRKMITPTFHYDILKDFLNVMNECGSELVDCIQQDIKSGKQVDITRRLKLCALDTISETAMGYKIQAQTNEDSEYVKAIRKFSSVLMARKYNFFHKYDFIFNRSSLGKDHNKTIEVIHDYARRVIDEKLSASPTGQSSHETTPKRKAFLDMLIAAETEDGKSLTAEDIQEEVVTFMFGGHDTTGNTLMWCVFLLGHYPDKQKKLQDELDLVFGGDRTWDVTFDHINELHYLDLVIKEVLRLYPAIASVGRNLDEELVLDGVTLPKGQDVTIFIYFLHRHPDVWEEPNKFIPERFETESRLKSKQSPFSYIPFAAGPRNCVGQRFAVQEMKVILVKIFRQFSVVSCTPEEEVNLNMGVVLEPVQEFDIKVTERPL